MRYCYYPKLIFQTKRCDVWSEVDNGETIGTIGSESGEIIKDEDHSKGARLTIEKVVILHHDTKTSR